MLSQRDFKEIEDAVFRPVRDRKRIVTIEPGKPGPKSWQLFWTLRFVFNRYRKSSDRDVHTSDNEICRELSRRRVPVGGDAATAISRIVNIVNQKLNKEGYESVQLERSSGGIRFNISGDLRSNRTWSGMEKFGLDIAYIVAKKRGEKLLSKNALKTLERMGTIFEVIHTLSDYMEKEKSWEAFAGVIARDPVISMKVWRQGYAKAFDGGIVLRKPDPDKPPQTAHIQTALRYLGDRDIRDIVLQIISEEIVDAVTIGSPEYTRSFWCVSSLTGHVLLNLVESLELDMPLSIAFRTGLLLNVGYLFIAMEDEQVMRDILTVKWKNDRRPDRMINNQDSEEQEIYGKDLHAEKAAEFMRQANWSDMEVQVTRHHSWPTKGSIPEQYSDIIYCAHIAERVASHLIYANDELLFDSDIMDQIFAKWDRSKIPGWLDKVIKDAKLDKFNRDWEWPGREQMFEMMVDGKTRVDGHKRTYHRWLDHHKLSTLDKLDWVYHYLRARGAEKKIEKRREWEIVREILLERNPDADLPEEIP